MRRTLLTLTLLVLGTAHAHATPITILSQSYSTQARSGDGPSILTTALTPEPIEAMSRDTTPPTTGYAWSGARGEIGGDAGVLETGAEIQGTDGITESLASVRFSVSDTLTFNLATDGGYRPYLALEIVLLNLTDNVLLLRRTPLPDPEDYFGRWTLRGAYAFELEPLKEYQLRARTRITSLDAGRARVRYETLANAQPRTPAAYVPEPASALTLLCALALLVVTRTPLLAKRP